MANLISYRLKTLAISVNGAPHQSHDTNPTYTSPYMAADGWYLPEGGTSMMFHGRRHEDDTD